MLTYRVAYAHAQARADETRLLDELHECQSVLEGTLADLRTILQTLPRGKALAIHNAVFWLGDNGHVHTLDVVWAHDYAPSNGNPEPGAESSATYDTTNIEGKS